MAVSSFKILEALTEENTPDGIGLCNDFVAAQKTKRGCEITMGAPEQVMYWIQSGTHRVHLLIIKNEDFSRKERELNGEPEPF